MKCSGAAGGTSHLNSEPSAQTQRWLPLKPPRRPLQTTRNQPEFVEALRAFSKDVVAAR